MQVLALAVKLKMVEGRAPGEKVVYVTRQFRKKLTKINM